MYEYLKDASFLKEIDNLRVKEQYIKITVLTLDEKPIKDIQGKIVGGSLNLDGNSSVRRTCNLNMVASEDRNDLTNVDNLISINKKVKVAIGFKNTLKEYKVYKDYDIIWFPLGVFVVSSPSITHSSDGVNISLSLKDKMSLLNGECGGVLPASVTFHEYETVDNLGQYVVEKPTIYQIILEVVNHWGGEQLGKILINDLDSKVKKVMKWTGKTPAYLEKILISNEDSLSKEYSYFLHTDGERPPENENSEFITINSGYDIGFVYTDFTYPGELVGDAGTTVCDVLDKIKNTLGNYEYFYDIDGNFIFREKKNYLNNSQSTTIENFLNGIETNRDNVSSTVAAINAEPSYYLTKREKGKAIYVFDNSNLITSYSNNPQYGNIKNDFIVWGKRKNASGNQVPIKFHLAIDTKPKTGCNTFENLVKYVDKTDGNLTKIKRPLNLGDKNLPEKGVEGYIYQIGDIYVMWNAKKSEWFQVDGAEALILSDDPKVENAQLLDWRSILYLQGVVAEKNATASNYYYAELANEWPKLFDVSANQFLDSTLNSPEDLDFYLDFIDSSAEISKISIPSIGRRTKVLNDEKVNCIFEPDIPEVILIKTSNGSEDDNNRVIKERQIALDRKIPYIQVNETTYNSLAAGGHYNSAYNAIRDLLYQYTTYSESIQVSAIPIYYLEPNSRITVNDKASGIQGDYMINSMSIPLDVSGTMSLSCSRAIERI